MLWIVEHLNIINDIASHLFLQNKLKTQPESPWWSGNYDSFNGKFRGDLFNTDIFYTLREAQLIIE